jgi:hypothetical protein
MVTGYESCHRKNALNSSIQLGLLFELSEKATGKVTEVFANGFNYHTLDRSGNCIKGQQYALKSDFNHKITL